MAKDNTLLKQISDHLIATLPPERMPSLTVKEDVIYADILDQSDNIIRLAFDYPTSESDANKVASNIIMSSQTNRIDLVDSSTKSQGDATADIDVQRLPNEPVTIKNALDQQPNTATNNSEDLTQFQTSLTAIESRTSSTPKGRGEITVPIYIPLQEELDPRLISSQAVIRLEEARSDEQWAVAAVFLTLGSILGIMITYLTVDSPTDIEITRAGQIALGLFLFAFAASIVWLIRIHKRVNEAKAKVLASSTEVLKRGVGTIGVDKSDTGG